MKPAYDRYGRWLFVALLLAGCAKSDGITGNFERYGISHTVTSECIVLHIDVPDADSLVQTLRNLHGTDGTQQLTLLGNLNACTKTFLMTISVGGETVFQLKPEALPRWSRWQVWQP